MSEDNNNYETFVQSLPEDIQALGMARDSTSTEQFWKRVSDNLGMPAEASAYADIEGETIEFAEGQQAAIKSLALKAGLTRAQYKALAESIGSDAYTANSEATKAQKESDAKLQSQWGLAAEAKYQQAVDFAKSGGAPESLIAKLDSRTADADTMLWLSNLASKIAESPNATSQDNLNSGQITPDEAQDQMEDIMNNPKHPYHAGDKRAQEKMHRLMKAANPKRYA